MFKELLDTAVHRKGQGYWIRAEYGAGKTHFIAALTILLTNRDRAYGLPSAMTRSARLPGRDGQAQALPRHLQLARHGRARRQGQLGPSLRTRDPDALPDAAPIKIPVLSEELAVEWFEKQAGDLIKSAIASHFSKTYQTTPARVPFQGRYQATGGRDPGRGRPRGNCRSTSKRPSASGLLTSTTGSLNSVATTGCCSLSNEFRSWQERHEGKPPMRKVSSSLKRWRIICRSRSTRRYIVVVASQGDCPQKLMGAGRGTASSSVNCSRNRPTMARSSASEPGTSARQGDGHRRLRSALPQDVQVLESGEEGYFQAIFPFRPSASTSSGGSRRATTATAPAAARGSNRLRGDHLQRATGQQATRGSQRSPSKRDTGEGLAIRAIQVELRDLRGRRRGV